MLSGSADRTAKLWDLSAAKCGATLAGHNGTITEAVFADTVERRIVTASGDKTLKLWDLWRNTTELASFRGHTDSVTCCAVRNELLASGGQDRTFRLWLLPP